MIKKNRQSHNWVQLGKKKKKKRYPSKPANRNNQGYLAKLANRVIDSTKKKDIYLKSW